MKIVSTEQFNPGPYVDIQIDNDGDLLNYRRYSATAWDKDRGYGSEPLTDVWERDKVQELENLYQAYIKVNPLPLSTKEAAPTGMTTKELFEKCEEIGGGFDDIKNKRSSRRDVHAFLLLAELEPSNDKIISAASHDEIAIGVSMETIEALNEFQILEIVRCGVFFDAEEEYLGMSA